MPAVLEPEQVSVCLEPKATGETVQPLLAPAAERVPTSHPVSPRVNSPKNNDPFCVELAA
jgi:putative SOS response-associated peptidase YedK